MNLFKFILKSTIPLFFVIIYFSTVQAKNIDKFNNGNYISSYFSGILLLENNQYNRAYNYLKKLEGIEKSHIDFSSKYLFSLVNSGKLREAFNYAKKLEKNSLDTFESDLITGVYYLKNKKYELAKTYFLKLKKNQSRFILNNFLSNSLSNWAGFRNLSFTESQNEINKIDPKFKNLKNTQNIFLHCYFNSEKTDNLFKKLISDKKTDFTRYAYFYGTYLLSLDKELEAKEIIETSLKNYPRNLILNQFQRDLELKKYDNHFNCQNLDHIIAEIFYIAANALSSQSIYDLSNFYLHLAKYLHDDFLSFDALIAENFYNIENFDQAVKIYNRIEKRGDAYLWYSAKQKARILTKKDKKKESLRVLEKSFQKLSKKKLYEIFDYAQFLKSNKRYDEAIKYYTNILDIIDTAHPLYPEVADNRGVAYERSGNWEEAEKDLLSSLSASPDQAYVINYLAYSWIEQGIKINEALEMLKKANTLKPDDPYIIDSLGWALFKLKKYEDARKYLLEAVKLMPEDPIVNDHYGDVLWKNGKKIQARYFWNYVMKLEETEIDLKDKIKKLISGL